MGSKVKSEQIPALSWNLQEIVKLKNLQCFLGNKVRSKQLSFVPPKFDKLEVLQQIILV